MNPKNIYCPQCKRKMMKYDGRGTMPLEVNCKMCRKRVVYDPTKDKVVLKDLRNRTSAGGLLLNGV